MLSADATSPGTSLTHLDPATEHAIQPTFAPGGEQIVFTHVPGAFYANIDEIAVVDLDGSHLMDLGVRGTHGRLQP